MEIFNAFPNTSMCVLSWGMDSIQSVAIFIAILGLVSLSSGFSLIVVMVLYIEREFVLYIDGFVLIVEGFGLFFFILFW